MSNRLLITKTRVKLFMKKQGLRVAEDFCAALNGDLIICLIKIAKRTKGNKRTTVLSWDV